MIIKSFLIPLNRLKTFYNLSVKLIFKIFKRTVSRSLDCRME